MLVNSESKEQESARAVKMCPGSASDIVTVGTAASRFLLLADYDFHSASCLQWDSGH